MNRNKSLFLTISLLVIGTSILSFTISGMVFAGWNLFNPKYEISFDPDQVSLQNIQKFSQVKQIILDHYYEEVDENTLLEGATAGMAAAVGDPYTVYYTKEQMKKLKEISTKSVDEYVGVGINVIMDENNLLTVVEPFENSSAYEKGMLPGDKIIAVDDEDVTYIKDQDIIIAKIKGPKGTKVKLTVFRPSEGRSVDFELERRDIKYDVNIKSEMLSGGIGYIRLKSFNDVKIDALFGEHLKKLQDNGMKALVIDVRDNPGGYYDQVVKIADRLLPEGVIVYTQDRNNHKEIQQSGKSALNLPMAILINGNSASASEVLAGALKDHNKALLVGTKSFGKGIVQSVLTLEDGSGLKVTTSRYFTPSGICIHGIGIEPDVLVEPVEKYQQYPVSMIPHQEDAQLLEAMRQLELKMG